MIRLEIGCPDIVIIFVMVSDFNTAVQVINLGIIFLFLYKLSG